MLAWYNREFFNSVTVREGDALRFVVHEIVIAVVGGFSNRAAKQALKPSESIRKYGSGMKK